MNRCAQRLRAPLKSRARLAIGLAFLATLAGPAVAGAAEYEVFIDAEREEDLYDLYTGEMISEDTLETLLEVMRRGVDLDTADREDLYSLPNLSYDDADAILAYRAEAGTIGDPAALVAAGALSRAKLEAVAPFLIVADREPPLLSASGWARYRATWTVGDARVPPMVLQARVTTLRRLTLGVAAVTTNNRVADVRWDPNRDALSAEAPRTRVQVPKAFAQWDGDHLAAIVGSYRAGFGQRLTFDDSGRYTPNGLYSDDSIGRSTDMSRRCREAAGELAESPCAGAAGDVYWTPDDTWQEGLRGAAVGGKHLPLPVGWLQSYAFASYQTHDIYQYEIYDRARCRDPLDDEDDACRAPEVYLRRDDPLEPTTRHTFQTLPAMYDQTVAGGNLSWFHSRRAHLGATGYGAGTRWRVEGAELDFQEWSGTPYGGGPFGAAGVDAAWGRGWADLFVEVARSFDEEPGGGGGFGAVVRHTITFPGHELELSGRWYDRRFNNPFARPIAAADEFDGLRARDEAGGRVRYHASLADRLFLRSSLDLWAQPSEAQPKLLGSLRGDLQAARWVRPGLWIAYQDKDLRTHGRGACYEVSDEFDENGEEIPCGGEKVTIAGRVRFDPHRRVALTAQYQHAWVDDTNYVTRFREDASAWLLIATSPIDPLRLRARVRYVNEDLRAHGRLEESLWSYFEVGWTFVRRLTLAARYDLRLWLDGRESTQLRSPNPEHWLRAELTARF